MMATTAAMMRAWNGPTILSFGFRPFFLLAGMWAALAMALWIGMLSGHNLLATAFDPASWHAHEMLFGYLGAVIAGFLMTAVPNWTGRMPIVGWPLASLAALWLLGRVAVAVSVFAPIPAALTDLAFPTALLLVIAREILTGRNWQNLPAMALIGAFILANALFHISVLRGEYAAGGIGFRLGLAVAVMLISLIGGRIVPSFTRNWLAQRASTTQPVPFGGADKVVLSLGLASLALWVLWPMHPIAGIGLAMAGIAHLWRLSRWSGRHAAKEPLVWVLHIAYAFVPLGFVLMGASVFGLLPQAAAQHIWMAGAVGLMTMAVMTRASLGHSGRSLSASRATTSIYLALIGSVLARLAYGISPGTPELLHLAAGLWIAAFGGFAIIYWPVLVFPRIQRKAKS
ncbi:MAG: NnrS family protein [Aestuariivirga sp.]|jgi:uncharacterized protein involved in response to NO